MIQGTLNCFYHHYTLLTNVTCDVLCVGVLRVARTHSLVRLSNIQGVPKKGPFTTLPTRKVVLVLVLVLVVIVFKSFQKAYSENSKLA